MLPTKAWAGHCSAPAQGSPVGLGWCGPFNWGMLGTLPLWALKESRDWRQAPPQMGWHCQGGLLAGDPWGFGGNRTEGLRVPGRGHSTQLPATGPCFWPRRGRLQAEGAARMPPPRPGPAAARTGMGTRVAECSGCSGPATVSPARAGSARERDSLPPCHFGTTLHPLPKPPVGSRQAILYPLRGSQEKLLT